MPRKHGRFDRLFRSQLGYYRKWKTPQARDVLRTLQRRAFIVYPDGFEIGPEVMSEQWNRIALRNNNSSGGEDQRGTRPMYFLGIEKLKREMAARPLSEAEALPYLVAFVGLAAAVSYIPHRFANVWDGLGAVWSIALAVVATLYIYRKNGGAGGHYFLQRYFAIGWVVGIRCLLIIILAGVAFNAAVATLGIQTEDTAWHDFAFVAIGEAVVYWRIGHHVGVLADQTKSV